ncbi:MAG: hypothetical protein NUW12_10740 [Firmicutes bacterium]|jgi:hypothetical protein|nr:hypothetical protein [Bacillota bacterium]MDH7496458.1 hypothetical protein [Bacillota bacterium]
MARTEPDIVELVLAAGTSVAVVGMSKNCGKTVTLGAILRGLGARGISVGVVSAGRDGEDLDAVTMLPKPPIWLPDGALFATSEHFAVRARAKVKPVAATDHASALGRLMIYRVLAAGKVEVGGGNSLAAARDAIALMRRLGASFVAVDGAAGRKFSCAPSLVDATVLATGAALGETMDGVVRRSGHAVRTLTVPAWDAPAAARLAESGLSHADVVLVLRDGPLRRLSVPSLLLRIDEVANEVTENVEAVVVGGALTGGFLRALLRRRRSRGITVVVRDSTRILADLADVQRFSSAGGRLAQARPIRLVAVTANPTSPDGRRFDPAVFLDNLAEAVAPVPVFDVVAGASRFVSPSDRTGVEAS